MDLLPKLNKVRHHFFKDRLAFEGEYVRKIRECLEVADVAS